MAPSRVSPTMRVAVLSLLACISCTPSGRLSGQVFIVTQGRENTRLGLVNVLLYPESTMAAHLGRKEQLAHEKLATLRATLTQWRDSVVDVKKEAGRIRARMGALEDAYIAGRIGTGEWETRGKGFRSEASRNLARIKAADVWFAVAESVYYSSNAFFLEGLPEPLASIQTDADGRFSLSVPSRGRFVLTAHTERTLPTSKESYFWLVRLSNADFARGMVLLSNDNLASTPSALLAGVSP